MLEIMMAGGKSTYYPNSGPGGKVLLKGDETAGYFGWVSEQELLPVSTLRTKAALATGSTLNNGTHGWYKFIRDGKILYISQRIIWQGVNWNILYNAGMVYGTKGTGLFPVGAGVEQFNPFPVTDITDQRQWVVVPRLHTGFNADPAVSATQVNQSEVYRLLRQISINPLTDPVSWANIPTATMDGSLFAFGKETFSTEAAPFSLSYSWPGSVNGQFQLAKSGASTSANTGWRPVLDLYSPEGIILGVENIQGQFSGIRPPQFRQKVDIIGTPITEISGIGWFTSKATPVALHGTIIEE